MDVLQEVLSACHVDSLEMQKEMQDCPSIDQLQPSFTLSDFSQCFNEFQPVDTQQQPPIFNQHVGTMPQQTPQHSFPQQPLMPVSSVDKLHSVNQQPLKKQTEIKLVLPNIVVIPKEQKKKVFKQRISKLMILTKAILEQLEELENDIEDL